MNITDFTILVAEYMNRSGVVFDVNVEGGIDKVRKAANMAKAWAQRTHKFERCKAQAQVVVDKVLGGSLKDATFVGTSIPVVVRNIEEAFIMSVDGTGLVPIDRTARSRQVDRLRNNAQRVPLDEVMVGTVKGPNFLQLVQHGLNLFVWPWNDSVLGTTETTIVLDIVEFLPDYSATVTEDFFLVECQDWLLYRTISHLNMFLKEDQRVPISVKVMDDAWEAVRAWDNSLIEEDAPID